MKMKEAKENIIENFLTENLEGPFKRPTFMQRHGGVIIKVVFYTGLAVIFFILGYTA